MVYNGTMNYTLVQKAGLNEDVDGYVVQGGGTIKREYGTLTPNGNPMSGRWAYRDGTGKLIDFDQYRHDLFEHNNLREAP